MTPQSVPAVLRAAADLIEPEGAWTTGSSARNRWGESVGAASPEAVCFCAVGALYHVAKGDKVWELARDAVQTFVSCELVSTWNDRHAQIEVVQALRAAADQAERGAL